MLKNALGGEQWEEPYGVQGMVMQYAMTAQRYLSLPVRLKQTWVRLLCRRGGMRYSTTMQ